MCKCINVELQSYDNQSLVYYPDWFISEKKHRCAGIDNCILIEILELWKQGIQTTESCCGHNKVQGYISVFETPENFKKMIELGYEPYQSNFRNSNGWDENGFRADTFNPKSVDKFIQLYRYKWKLKDNERPIGFCYDCRMKYGEFPDMTISNELWEQINPTEHEGAGILCPTCIANRLNYLGLWYSNKLNVYGAQSQANNT